MDLATLAGQVARGVGSEFPAPVPEMALREYVHLVEEAEELVVAMTTSSLADIRGELADVELTAALVAHYLGIIAGEGAELRLEGIKAVAFASFTPTYPSIYGAVAGLAGPLRRYLGIARRSGELEPVLVALGTVMLTVNQLAVNHGVNLELAVEDKAHVVLSRGWREGAPVTVADILDPQD